MYQLSDTQIDYILNDISARGVEMESLQLNLHDHVCCIIENNLEENGDFESFYKKTIKTFYKDALWEIEEETFLLLTFKNYYAMKKIMIISGTFSASVMSLGILFKLMHWPGASAFILLSIVISSFIFLPLLFILKARETKSTKDKLIIGIGITFGILFSLSSLFKIMHWPGSNTMWIITIALLLFVFVPLYFFSGIRNPETKINTIITTIILIAAGGMLFTMTNLRPQARPLDNTEIEYLVNDEEMLKSEAENLYVEGRKDTILNQRIKLVREINTICNELKSELLEYEIGQKSIKKDLKDKNVMISVGLVSNFFVGNNLYLNKLHKLSNLVGENSIKCYIEKLRLTKKESIKKSIQFRSSILHYEFYSFYYNNTILGAYKDLCEVQLDAMEEVKDLIEIKKSKLQ